jgi:hypothetical protein
MLAINESDIKVQTLVLSCTLEGLTGQVRFHKSKLRELEQLDEIYGDVRRRDRQIARQRHWTDLQYCEVALFVKQMESDNESE